MGYLLHKSPKFYDMITFSYSLAQQFWEIQWVLIGWFIKFSVQTFQQLIWIYKRGNFVLCTSIHWPLSYPFRSLTATNNENQVQETFKCAICREVFDDNIDFKQHQKDTGHTRGRKKHKCPTCCILLSRSAYYYHVTSCNAENIVYKCYVCREVFQDIETLTKHEKKFGHVRSKKRVKCHKCTKSVAPSGYFTHMENYHSLKHKCQKCDEG